jgi:benzoylformate decarboxylase
MGVITGKRAFLELLRQEGVEFLFGNPGTTELPLMDALAVESVPRYVLGLQEAAVVAMADGYAQASGKLAAVNLHVAPGLGNGMGMLYDAQKAGAPLLVTAGQHDQSFVVTEPILWGDLPTIARPLVKYSTEVHRLADLPRLVHRAAKIAMSPPTGPVFLSLPGDVLNDEADLDLGAPTRVAPRHRGDAEAVDAAARLLAAAENPVLTAGDQVAQSGALAEMVRLAELLGAPVWAELIPNTASFPSSHPLFKGAMTRSQKVIRGILQQHDLLFSAGADLFALSLPSDVEAVPEGMAIIQLDTDPYELGKSFPAKIAILGDPKPTLHDLTEALERVMTPGQREAAKRRLERSRSAAMAEREQLLAKARADRGKTPVKAAALLQALGEILPKDAVVVDETISSGPGLRQFIRSDDPKSFFGMRGGGIGWGLPAAVGIKLAVPDRPVVALVGDGSAMYTCQVLWTAAHERTGVVFVILNNGSYRILKQRTQALRGHAAQTGIYVAMDLIEPRIDYVGLARSLGVEAERAGTVAEACDLVRKGVAGDKPLLVDVAIDPSF